MHPLALSLIDSRRGLLLTKSRCPLFLCVLCTTLLTLLPLHLSASSWQPLDQGLEVLVVPFEGVEQAITIVRIDPEHFHFFLCTAAAEQSSSRTLREWAVEKDLACVINASMYLTDGRTSTGYMRQGPHVNNPRISRRFGAFFVAHPDRTGLPEVDILERDTADLPEILKHYELVVQNYRLISRDQRILWPKAADRHAVAAVGVDTHGSVLFIFCRTLVTPHALAQELLTLPLQLRSAMYVEGGSQAGLFVRAHTKGKDMQRFPFLDFEPELPNVLGIRRKTSAAPAAREP